MDEDQVRSWLAELSAEANIGYSANALAWGTIELEAELSEWLARLPARHFAAVAFHLDLLAARGPQLSWPHTRQLDSKLHELRLHLDGRAVRTTYWIASGHRIVLLTVFMKARMREEREIARARRTLKRSQVERRVAAQVQRHVVLEEGNG
jgi:phage-related protein